MARDTEEVRIAGVADDGRPRVEYKRVEHAASHTTGEYRTLPPWVAAFCPDASIPMSDLPPWVADIVETEVSG